MKRIVPILFFVALLSFQSCKDSITGFTLSDLRTVVPLHVGATWKYLDIAPSDIPTFPPDSTFVTTTVSGYLDSVQTRYFELSGLIGASDESYFESADANHYQRFKTDNTGHLIPAGTILKTPVRQGARWASNDKDSTLGYVEIANADTTVRTAAGVFKNVIYVREHWAGGSRWFILPGTGIVYEILTTSTSTVTRELVSKNF